ncbi:MAG TPA: serine/threonine-protein phosphatase, partial [Catenuloplanes sp.]
MGDNRSSQVDFANVLRAVENAAPVDAVEAVTRGIGVDLGALWVSFLVADMSGRALVRLAHVPVGDLPGRRRQDEDVATVLAFDGGPQEQALRSQQVLVRPGRDGYVVMAPVTERGEAIGLLEMCMPVQPDGAALA